MVLQKTNHKTNRIAVMSFCSKTLHKTEGSAPISSPSYCPDSTRTFSKRLLLEKHIQLMHGIKEAERKSVVESSSTEESTVKDQVIFTSCMEQDALNLHLHRYLPFMTYYTSVYWE